MEDEIYYVNYKDDGPVGFCGQTCKITNPKNQLYVFNSYDKMREFMDNINKVNRKNPRIVRIWEESCYHNDVIDCTEKKGE